MRQSIFILCLLLGFNAMASEANRTELFPTYTSLDLEQIALEDELFTTEDTLEEETITIESIEVVEIEEEVELGFDTAQYLPKGFNALKGKNDINWDEIELVELEEEVEYDFDTSKHVPENFNPYKGMQCNSSVVMAINLN